MIQLDDELAKDYLAECCEHLVRAEADLLTMDERGAAVDPELVNSVFRAVHSVKGGAGFFDLAKIRELAHHAENVLARIRSGKMTPTREIIRILLRATDQLHQMAVNPGTSNQADIAELMAALGDLCAEPPAAADKSRASLSSRNKSSSQNKSAPNLRMLLVEDDFGSRNLLQTFLARYGECHVAVNGREAVDAFRCALEDGHGYHLVCMDIMMPEMDGREAVRRLRAIEQEHGIFSSSGAKIVMTTAVTEIKEVIRCFKELCDAYLMKPIDLEQLVSHLEFYQLIPVTTPKKRKRSMTDKPAQRNAS